MKAYSGRVRLLLFDLDGTLVRAGGAGRKALNQAIHDCLGIKQDAGVYNLAGKTDLRNFAEAIRGATGRRPGKEDIERVHREYLRVLPRWVADAVRAGKYELCEGVGRLLRALAPRPEVMLALGTGNMELGARIKLEPSGLNRYFEFGGFGSDSYSRPALLRRAFARALARLNGASRVSPRDTFVIGDTPLDVAAGKRAGFKTIAVATGFTPWEDLVRARPTHLARDFREVRTWLQWLGLEA